MSPDRVSAEYGCRIYNDDHGYWVEVKPDGDGLDLCQITYSDGDANAETKTITLPWEMADKLAMVIDVLSDLNPHGE